MSENLLVIYCAPTLAGIKTANLFSCKCTDCCSAKLVVDSWNSVLNHRGVYVRIMRHRNDRALIYVYRRDKLAEDFRREGAKEFLCSRGYGDKSMSDMLDMLALRLCESSDFPHEIGLFLGYPLGDVKGFIENEGKNCKLAGIWKVYGDECEAKKLFCKYRKCTDIYCKKLHEGTPITRLAVKGGATC